MKTSVFGDKNNDKVVPYEEQGTADVVVEKYVVQTKDEDEDDFV